MVEPPKTSAAILITLLPIFVFLLLKVKTITNAETIINPNAVGAHR